MAEIWGAALIAGAAVVGAVASYSASSKQASAQKQAAQTQADMFNTITGQEQPFMSAGYDATSREQELLGIGGNKGAADYGSFSKPFNASDYLANKDPGYQFQLQTGEQALRNADTPGVGSLSGPALKDLMGFNQSMAATGYQNAFNRYQTTQGNTWNRLQGLSQTGQNAASNTGQAGSTLGTGIAQAQAAAGASQASGILGAAGSFASGASTIGGMAYLNNGNSQNGYQGGGGGPGYIYNGVTQNGGQGGGIGNIVGNVEGGS